MAARIDHLVTSGTFALDGGTWDVDNNVWIVGDDSECVVIDAAHDAEAILAAVGGRTLRAVLLTHAHTDHIDAVAALLESVDVPVLLHQGDRVLWDAFYPDSAPSGVLEDGQVISVGGTELEVRHTPGHTPGAVCFVAAELGTVFTGDTLFQGGPGATGRSYSSFPTIIDSITDRLLTLPDDTVVRTGHGPTTTIGTEKPDREVWIARGH
ncbi:MBL fold metallo-hydrolase [Rathayibacter festucae]|uniref:MBL fold metallo-hydrolase n=1 Tax=Rathayibacter festucae TaxID=110937 RepID=UPI001FB34CE7|nr:MBL fold metallo-hydrolase [Rathayibacter festucae]MCJ1698359.1 MBL fold metallo-hydrolase [Rathayibacter festucae]